ncbi:MAG TPA: ABATE domain-containing protein [Candidatus Limnocylindrales bacterium]
MNLEPDPTPGDRQGPHEHAVPLEMALAFVNTLEYERGEPVDHLTSTAIALDWLHDHGLTHGRPTGHGDAPLARVRRARGALRELIDSTVDGRPPATAAVAEVNRLLRAHEVLELVLDGDGLTLGHRHHGDPVEDALARLAEPLAREVSGDRRARFRICANDRCRWAFYDTSRTGVRRWCDMSSCGNRAKAARHRARARGQDVESDRPS